jgi:predicted nucleic acid-binding protein
MYLADANVLYSRVLRDYLLYSVRAKLISVAWSQAILNEMTEHLMANRASFTQESANRLIQAINTTFPHAQHDPGDSQYQELALIKLPDEGDRHVIAAALAADASFICTNNVKDFPSTVLGPLGLTVITPDNLLSQLVREHPRSMLWVHRISTENLNGATDQSTVAALRRTAAPETANLMEQLLAESLLD